MDEEGEEQNRAYHLLDTITFLKVVTKKTIPLSTGGVGKAG